MNCHAVKISLNIKVKAKRNYWKSSVIIPRVLDPDSGVWYLHKKDSDSDPVLTFSFKNSLKSILIFRFYENVDLQR